MLDTYGLSPEPQAVVDKDGPRVRNLKNSALPELLCPFKRGRLNYLTLSD